MASCEPASSISRVEQGAMAPQGYVHIGSQNFYNQPSAPQSDMSSQDRMTNLIASLDFDQRDLRQHSINSTMAQSCQWLTACDEYRTWVQSYDGKKRPFGLNGENKIGRGRQFAKGNQLLWIKGKPGVGKSTLMKFALLQARKRAQESDAGDLVLAHFFHARGVELERSIEGLYRTFLAQLLEESDPDFITTLPPSLVSLILRKKWNVVVLKELLEAVLNKRHPSPITWFIDALDECSVETIREMMDHFALLLRNFKSQGQAMHLCMASRHYPELTINYPHLDIVVENEQGHRNNISTYIDLHLSIGDSRLAQDIQTKLKIKAEGVFMWTALVIDVLRTQYSQTATLQGLEKALDQIPADLSKLFSDILTKGLLAKETNVDVLLPWRQTTLCLQLVFYKLGPLSPEALCWALISIGESNLARIEERYAQSIEDGIERYIRIVSRGLVESRGRIDHFGGKDVQFIHQSVQDFLGGEEGFRALVSMEGLCCKDLASYEVFCHGKLKDICANELFVTFRHTNFPRHVELWKESPGHDEVLRRYPFLKYAAEHALRHANEQQRLGNDQQEFLQSFDQRQWFQSFETTNPFRFPRQSGSFDPDCSGWVYLLIQQGHLTSLLEDCQLPELVAARQSPSFGVEPAPLRQLPALAIHLLARTHQIQGRGTLSSETARSVVRIHLRQQQELRPQWYPILKGLSDNLTWCVFNNEFTGFGNPILDVGPVDSESGPCAATFFLLVCIPLEVLRVPDSAQLETAAHEGLIPTVIYLVDQLGLKLHDLPFTTSELLLRSCANRNVDDTQWLLENGASVNTRSPWGLSPLHMLCCLMPLPDGRINLDNFKRLLKLLLDAGADLNTLDERYFFTVHNAAWDNINSVLQILQMHRADFNAARVGGKGIWPCIRLPHPTSGISSAPLFPGHVRRRRER